MKWEMILEESMRYLRHHMHQGRNQPKFLGFPCDKMTEDLWIMQEIIHEVKPDYIIELGTQHGGTTLYFATILDALNKGIVITVDIKDILDDSIKQHKRIKFLQGNSISPEIVKQIKAVVKKGKKVIVDLDTIHNPKQVLKELELYSPLVSKDSYIFVEDTMFDFYYFHKEYPEGPYIAIKEFLKNNKNFVIDESKEKFLITGNPRGYLRCIRK